MKKFGDRNFEVEIQVIKMRILVRIRNISSVDRILDYKENRKWTILQLIEKIEDNACYCVMLMNESESDN